MKRNVIEDEICAKRFKKNQLEEEIQKLALEFNEFAEIHRLPLLAMYEILRNLDIEDWFSFECVCQRWRQIAKEFANKPALVITKVIEGKWRRWHHSRKWCSPGSIIVRSTLDFDPEHSFLSTLRQLKITNRWEDRDSIRIDKVPLLTDLNFLNKLVCLEVLEIEKFDLDEDFHYSNNTLTLPNLQHLTIDHQCSPVQLNTPSLSSYRSKYLGSSSKFLFPEKIQRLHVGELAYGHNLKAFTNLEYLTFKRFPYSERNDDHLIEPPALKELSIRPNFKSEVDFDLLRSRTLQLLEKKRNLGKSDLRIIFFGFQLDQPDQLANFEYWYSRDCNSGNCEELVQANHSKLVETQFIKQIEYSADWADSNEFYRKLSHVEQVSVYDQETREYTPEKVDNLMNFFKLFKNFNALIFRGPPEPSFFEQLLAAFPLLRSLDVVFSRPSWNADGRSYYERRKLLKANSEKVMKLITEFQNLHKASFRFEYEGYFDVNDIEHLKTSFEYFDKENGYPYKVKKLQFFHRSSKIIRYELYVHDDRNSPPKFDKLCGDYSTLDKLIEALIHSYI